MQLVVFHPPGRTVRFKVMDEFGNRFEVNNCSSCFHWVTYKRKGPAVFSTEYKGCHVVKKKDSFHLTVSIEALLPSRRVERARDVTLICPKLRTPDHLTPITTTAPPSTSPAWTSQPSLGFTWPSTWDPEPNSSSASTSLGPEPTHPSPPPTPTLWGEPWKVDMPAHIGSQLTEEQCQVDSGHIPCLVGSSQQACQQVGCCYDNTSAVPCYYGNTVTAQCFRNGHVILVVSQVTALAHRVTLGNIRLASTSSSCSPTQKTGSFLLFHFPLTQCGTTLQAVGDQLIYENQLVSAMDIQKGPWGAVTRDGSFRLQVRCVFSTNHFLPIQASVSSPTLPGPVTQSGPLRLELRIARDETFSTYYEEQDYPVTKLLRQPLPVEVRLLQRTDPGLALVLHQCWATPSANPFQQPQWPLLVDGCPFGGDNYRTRMVAVDGAEVAFPSHHQRFTVATFALLDSSSQRALQGSVYFFCSASACTPSGNETCSISCSRSERRRRSSGGFNDTAGPQNIVSSPGPVGFKDSWGQEQTPGPTGATRSSTPKSLLWALLLLLAVAVLLGVGVCVGLVQASPRRPRKALRG
ncbi:zona pellucida sperm-binding protein 1 [Erinaceus europaeus]|uniref:Zona pellucida sperm-binding protein 1 n=1 Tax=Erinaceus europaeus TaxID=9365 RepID=A0A1S2ZI42_ERIEU|nr:zona pellucida sperm-binding protein 1 [Erinaceus europaeus]